MTLDKDDIEHIAANLVGSYYIACFGKRRFSEEPGGSEVFEQHMRETKERIEKHGAAYAAHETANMITRALWQQKGGSSA